MLGGIASRFKGAGWVFQAPCSCGCPAAGAALYRFPGPPPRGPRRRLVLGFSVPRCLGKQTCQVAPASSGRASALHVALDSACVPSQEAVPAAPGLHLWAPSSLLRGRGSPSQPGGFILRPGSLVTARCPRRQLWAGGCPPGTLEHSPRDGEFPADSLVSSGHETGG